MMFTCIWIFPLKKKDLNNLQSNFKHHIGQIIVKYLSFLCDFNKCVKSPISHPHPQELHEKFILHKGCFCQFNIIP